MDTAGLPAAFLQDFQALEFAGAASPEFRSWPDHGLARMEIPSIGGVARSAGVGSPIDNPHQVVSYTQNPLKSPLVQGGTLFSSNVAPQRGMKNSCENSY